MRRLSTVVAMCVVLIGTTQKSFAGEMDKGKLTDLLSNARGIIEQVMAVPDYGIPEKILTGGSCVVVVPRYKQGALGTGTGVATCRTPMGWSAPVFLKLEGGSFGSQKLGRSTDLILVVMNANGLEQMENKVRIGSDADFPTYSWSNGLLEAMDLNGTLLSQSDEDTRLEDGADVSFAKIVSGNVPVPQDARPFVRTVAKHFTAARETMQDHQMEPITLLPAGALVKRQHQLQAPNGPCGTGQQAVLDTARNTVLLWVLWNIADSVLVRYL